MGLRTKFNVVLWVSFVAGLFIVSVLSREILTDNAKKEALRNAEVLMEVAKSVRSYTAMEIRPLLQKIPTKDFLPQTVPAYAATQNMQHIQKVFPEFYYKEAALNPTNPEHRAIGWEKDIIEFFRNNSAVKYYSNERNTPNGKHLFLSRPFKITNKACLSCHSRPENAPISLIKRYGSSNGFNWKHNEIIGAQLVSVPMSVSLKRADEAFNVFMFSLAGVFIGIGLLLNILLHFMVIRPVTKMAKNANTFSLGDMSVDEFNVTGKDEMASLAASFNRMHRSLKSAVKLLDKTKT